MRLAVYNRLLNVAADAHRSFSYDESGRLFAAYRSGWFVRRSLTGEMSARKWDGDRRQTRGYSPIERETLIHEAHASIKDIFTRGLSKTNVKVESPDGGINDHDVARWLERIESFDLVRDAAGFREVYHNPVGILPPDQYMPIVVQVTEGCVWNKCGFCRFYKGRSYRKKSFDEIREHIRQIIKNFGRGISLRNSIFLGEANTLAYEIGMLVKIVRHVRKELGGLMPFFRGVAAFMDPHMADLHMKPYDFTALRQAGLTTLYIGLETGDETLRRRINKPCSVSDTLRQIDHAKKGGLAVGIIVMLGLGGRGSSGRHLQYSLEAIRHMALDRRDMIFLSPLQGDDGMGDGDEHAPLSRDEIVMQYRTIQNGLPQGIRSSLYEIDGFIY